MLACNKLAWINFSTTVRAEVVMVYAASNIRIPTFSTTVHTFNFCLFQLGVVFLRSKLHRFKDDCMNIVLIVLYIWFFFKPWYPRSYIHMVLLIDLYT